MGIFIERKREEKTGGVKGSQLLKKKGKSSKP